jgi:hypothetical protein
MGRELVEQRYTVPAVTGQLETLYETLIAGRRGSTPVKQEEAVCG